MLPSKSDMPSDALWYAEIELAAMEISVSKDWNGERTGKVNVRARPPELGLDHNSSPSNRGEFALPEASVSVARPLAAIAKDITRRVIMPAAAPLAKRVEYAAAIVKRRKGVAEMAEELGRFPGLTVRLERSGDSASLYASDPYLSGRLDSDGSVTLDRLSSLSLEKFAAVWAAIGKEA